MLPLNVSSALLRRPGCRRPISTFFRGVTVACALVPVLSGGRVSAQAKPGDTVAPQAKPGDAPVAQAAPPTVNFRERPKYPTESQRLRRTVTIDGVLSDGEWDPFYTVADGPIKGTVFCNWDENYLYLAVRTDQPATVLFDVDASGDGWLRGADNLEIIVGSVGDPAGATTTVRLLDAASSKDAPAWNEKAVDPKSLLVGAKIVGGTQVVEIGIPKNTGGLTLRPGATVGLRAEFLPPGPASAYTPTQPFEPHLLLDATLVESRAQAMQGVNPRLTLSDYKCIPGQKLFATLELLNQTDIALPVRSLTWTGQGNAVDTIKEVSVAPLPPYKSRKYGYKTMLPAGLPNGSYALTATAEMDGGKQVTATATFTVVEPLQAQMSSEPSPVAVSGPTKLDVIVDVFTNVPNAFHGDVELTTFPSNWQLQGDRRRKLAIERRFASGQTRYTFTLLSNTAAGDYPVEATVLWHGRPWKLRHVVHVVRPDLPPAK